MICSFSNLFEDLFWLRLLLSSGKSLQNFNDLKYISNLPFWPRQLSRLVHLRRIWVFWALMKHLYKYLSIFLLLFWDLIFVFELLVHIHIWVRIMFWFTVFVWVDWFRAFYQIWNYFAICIVSKIYYFFNQLISA